VNWSGRQRGALADLRQWADQKAKQAGPSKSKLLWKRSRRGGCGLRRVFARNKNRIEQDRRKEIKGERVFYF
jgi:hypothetical protein